MTASLDDMLELVQTYIMHRKNVNIGIIIRDAHDMILLQRAYAIAKTYFDK